MFYQLNFKNVSIEPNIIKPTVIKSTQFLKYFAFSNEEYIITHFPIILFSCNLIDSCSLKIYTLKYSMNCETFVETLIVKDFMKNVIIFLLSKLA